MDLLEIDPKSEVALLNPRQWKARCAANPLRSALDRTVKNASA
jgi:hypothetical protein